MHFMKQPRIVSPIIYMIQVWDAQGLGLRYEKYWTFPTLPLDANNEANCMSHAECNFNQSFLTITARFSQISSECHHPTELAGWPGATIAEFSVQ